VSLPISDLKYRYVAAFFIVAVITNYFYQLSIFQEIVRVKNLMIVSSSKDSKDSKDSKWQPVSVKNRQQKPVSHANARYAMIAIAAQKPSKDSSVVPIPSGAVPANLLIAMSVLVNRRFTNLT
jgi:hypothetical protein